jgi:hypothetical protein
MDSHDELIYIDVQSGAHRERDSYVPTLAPGQVEHRHRNPVAGFRFPASCEGDPESGCPYGINSAPQLLL